MTAEETDRAALDGAARRDAQRRLAEACAARDWDGVRAAAEAGASAYGNEILDRLLEMPDTPGLVETIEWLEHHHAARGDRLYVFAGDEEIAGAVVLQRAGMSPHLSTRKLAALAVHRMRNDRAQEREAGACRVPHLGADSRPTPRWQGYPDATV